jgi:hypothetical protein
VNETIEKLERAARYRRIRVEITTAAAARLRDLADEQKRTVHQQAAFMLEQMLLREEETVCTPS